MLAQISSTYVQLLEYVLRKLVIFICTYSKICTTIRVYTLRMKVLQLRKNNITINITERVVVTDIHRKKQHRMALAWSSKSDGGKIMSRKNYKITMISHKKERCTQV